MASMYRILYVDDEPALLEIGKLFLEQGGQFIVDIISSAPDALAALNTTSYDAIISDYQMPEMDGIEFLKKVRNAGNTIPFILFTGKGREEVVIEAINSGADFYLQKGGEPTSQFAELSHKIQVSVEHHRAAEKIQSLNRLYSVISATNKAIVHLRTKSEFFSEICEILVETGGFRMAWIGVPDPEQRTIRPIASAGHIDGYLDHISLSTEDVPDGCGTTGRAFRTGKYYISNDITTDPCIEPWRENALKRGYLANASFPFAIGTKNAGVISLYASVTGFFDEQIIHLLGELSVDISFALKTHDDQHDRKEAEETLRKSEAQLRRAEEIGRSGSWEFRLHENAVLASDGAQILYGLEGSQWTIDEVQKIPLPEYRPLLDTALRDLVAGKSPYNITFRIRRRSDGEILDIHSLAEYDPVRDAVFGVIHDITDRKRVEVALQESEEKYRSVIENIQDMFYRSDLAGNLIMASPSCLRTLGYESYDEIINKPISETFYFSPEKREELLRILTEHGSIMDYEVQLKRRDGTPVWVSTSSHYYRGVTGAIAGVEGIFRDITRRRDAEEALKHDAAQLKQIIDLVPHMIFAKDWNGKYLLANRAVAEGYDTTVADLVGKSHAQFHGDSDELRHMLDDDREVITTGTTKFIPEEPYIDAFGKRRILQTTKVPFTTLGNNQQAVLGVAVDITERKRVEEELLKKNEELNASYEQIAATEEELRSNFDELTRREQALKESEERYRNVVEDQTEFISRCLPDSTHVFVNDAYCRYFGMKSDEILGHRFRPRIPADDRERVKQFFLSLTPDHPVDVIEHRIIMPDGSIRWHRWSDRAIFDSSGTITEYQSVGQDITERKLEEQALYENEQRLTSIYNTVGDIIFQLTVEPHEQYRFSSVNSAFSRATGLPYDQVVGRSVNGIIPEPSLSVVLGKYRRAIAEKTIVRWEETSGYPTGQLTGEVRIAPIFDQDGTCTCLIGSVHDISERRLSEEAFRLANKKLKLLTDITRHDVNNQLLTLQGYLAMLEMKRSDPAFMEYFQKAQETAERISATIRFTREYELIGANAPAWQECRTLVETAAKQSWLGNVTVRTEIPAGIELFADPLIVRVFYNLMDNAIRHGGKITTIRFFTQESGADHHIVCEDDGEGIPEDIKEKIFDRCFGKNTGLGLFLAREILSITGIEIRETGEPGKGARFVISFPKGTYRFAGK